MSFPSDEPKPAVQIELQHFLHEHLLVYTEYNEFEKCDLCRGFIITCHYSCKRCKFYLHERCAKLPRYNRNSLHPMHDLQLAPKGVMSFGTKCSLCEKLLDILGYKCSACDFNLHIKCATVSTFDPKDHEHAFINFKPTLFICDACGIDEKHTKCFSCVCSICYLQVHGKCRQMFPLPPTVRQRMHNHELKLCYSFEIGFDFGNKLCKICSEKLNDVFCLYQCKDGCTSYIAHATCATSRDFLIDHKETAHNTSKEDEQKEIDTQQEHVIKHFSHPHALVLNNVRPQDDDDDDDDDDEDDDDDDDDVVYVCYGCARPVSAPFYTCTRGDQCNFFLHKQCCELPETILSPIHQHPLALNDFSELRVKSILIRGFTCQACQVRCNGFVYRCIECYDTLAVERTFDVECTLLGDTLQHASHKCQLALVSTIPNEENRCVGCDSTFSTAFWCEECNFFIDLKCASLPRTIGHDCPTGTVWSIKPLKLRYDCIEHAGGQYYCDLCEETRGKDLWFYYCEDCRESIHPRCLLGDNKVLYGKSYVIDGHCHPIRVAKKPKTDPLCDTCGKACQQSPLAFCPTCNVYFHGDPACCGISSSSRYKRIKNYCCGTSSSPDVNQDSDGNGDDDDENDPEISIGSDTLVGRVNHFSHPHSLIIGEYDREKLWDEVCAGCVMPISAPFYTCADKDGECNFFLHGECFELPKQIQYPLHLDHPLVLDLPGAEEVGFICYGCVEFSNGFVYTCLACKFFLDVRCSLLSDTLVHETHPCTLTLADKNTQRAEGEIKCNLCETDCCSCLYSCDECSFALHLHCASLPKTVLHICSENNWETRPQHLIDAAAAEDDQDGSRDDKNCEACGDPIGGNGWYYYCEDCNEATHSRCSSFLFRKGVVYQAYNHFHNLVTSIAVYNKDCAVCDARMEVGPALYCDTCEVYLHIKCCRRLRRA